MAHKQSDCGQGLVDAADMKSWLQILSYTYDTSISDAGKRSDEEYPLLPICHTTVRAHIAVTVDISGNLVRVSLIPKESSRTIIPCTEESGGRTSGRVSHPLADNLTYVAGDYYQYEPLEDSEESTKKSKKRADVRTDFKNYVSQLEDWCKSEYGNDYLRAVLSYVSKGCLCKDLLDLKVIELDEGGKFKNEWKPGEEKPELCSLVTGDLFKAVVKWKVQTRDFEEIDLSADSRIWDSWSGYSMKKMADVGFCYATGENVPIASNHPFKIRNDGDKAKLISSNDISGFTFRGRFTDGQDACSIGFTTTQKAHSALRWLISKQGYKKGDWCIVSWVATGGKSAVNPVVDPMDLFDYPEDTQDSAYTGKISSDIINKMVRGYHGRADEKGIATMVLDSAGPGRLSIINYHQFTGSAFEDSLNHWYESCSWPRQYKRQGDERKIWTLLPPSLVDIVKCAYGSNVDDKLMKSTLNRLIVCITERAPVPIDIVNSVLNNACRPVAYEPWEWERMLSLACGLYKKMRSGEEYEMVLDKNRKTRDYLYGRLLAVADRMENYALFLANEKRQTNAMRSFQAFADRPFSTWRNLEVSLGPYRARLGSRSAYFDNTIMEIMDMFDPNDFNDDKRLSGEFLLGFYTQRANFMTKKDQMEE